jgi:hypothetical protein
MGLTLWSAYACSVLGGRCSSSPGDVDGSVLPGGKSPSGFEDVDGAFLRRRYTMTHTTIPITARPPTTPPTMAPTGVGDEPVFGVEVDVGFVDVAGPEDESEEEELLPV